MRLPPLEEGTFLERLNRFACRVRRSGREENAHLPNSGRLWELLCPGRKVLLAPASGARRRTASDLVLVWLEEAGWVCADARLPPALLAEGVQRGRLAPFQGYNWIKREVVFAGSRLDLRLEDGEAPLYLEAKSVTLVVGGTARFPDAPTARGRHHLESLVQARRQGHRAAIAFVVQRGDARRFSPSDDTDPAFGTALRRAAGEGVEVYAFWCQVGPRRVEIRGELPVVL